MTRRFSALVCAIGAMAFAMAFLSSCDSDGGGSGGGGGGGTLGGGLSKLFKGGGGGGGGGGSTPDDGGGDDGGGDDGGGDGGSGGGGSGAATCAGVCNYIMDCIGQKCAPVVQADSEGTIRGECSSSCSSESPSASELGQVYNYSCTDIWGLILGELDSQSRANLDQVCSGQTPGDDGGDDDDGFDDDGFDDDGFDDDGFDDDGFDDGYDF
jgi:hypothetical protein